jgi:heptosyltransferase-2
VSGDTGIAHLAAALGVATVTLFGPTDPRLTAPRSPRARIVAHPVPCSPCFLASCPIDHPCLRGISAEEVEDAVRGVAA